MTDSLTLAYIAGALDADGYFTIKRSTRHVRNGDMRVPFFIERIGLKQTSPQVPDLLRSAFGGTRLLEKPTAKHGKMLHSWQVTDRQAAVAAESLMPFLRVKGAQALLLLELRKLKAYNLRVHEKLLRRTKNGGTRLYDTAVLSKENVLARQLLFERIKALNDTRIWQPKLG